ncbi:MAG: serine/threonine protein kinase [Chthoniobacter sp.]|nr:serine/threonine protein kinase [Chthoniobacter sp.]
MNTKICSLCHTPIPADAPGGFCPACLLRDAAEPASAGRAAPTIAEIATAFPQLEIQSLIGQGGMGFVYKVRQPSLDRTVALKILSPELGRDPAFAERFAREARVLGKLNHPNIVTVFEHGESGGFFYLLMELVDGVNLRQAMRAGRFTPQQALGVVPGICDALQAAHSQGVWHRDIKPENILLDARGGVKIADFGIARIVGDPFRDFTLTATGGALGSAAYMAPEQHERPHDVDHRADIYSLGVVIYEMLTGELPLGRFPAPSERAAVSARIDEIVHQTLEKERALRQQSATEVKTQVEQSAKEPARPPIPPDLPRFSGTAIAGAVCAVVGIAALVLLILVQA